MKRRDFIRLTAATCIGLAATSSSAAIAQPKEKLIDVNVSLGRWPFRRLPLDDTSKLAKKLRDHGVTQAWAGNFTAAFEENSSSSNSRLAVACRKERGLFAPFGTVNLRLLDWERELNRCANDLRMPGLRLFPNYHGYKLSDPAFAKLLALAVEKNLVVQIVASLEDERTQPSIARTPHVNAKPLADLLPKQPGARVMLLNWHRPVKLELARQLARLGVCFDIATVENVGVVENLCEELSAERVMFGSHAPFFYFESAKLKLEESELGQERRAAICELNARRWLL